MVGMEFFARQMAYKRAFDCTMSKDSFLHVRWHIQKPSDAPDLDTSCFHDSWHTFKATKYTTYGHWKTITFLHA